MGVVRLSGESDANLTTAGYQELPWVSGFTDGRYVAVWRDAARTLEDGRVELLRGQAFNADGSRLGAEFTVHPGTGQYQYDARVMVLNDSTFVVSWQQNGRIIEAQAFTLGAQGPTTLGGLFGTGAPNTSYEAYSQLVRLSDSQFLMTWVKNGTLVGQMFSLSSGGAASKVGNEFSMAANFDGVAAISVLSPTQFVNVYRDYNADDIGANETIRGQVYNFNGGTPTTAGSAFTATNLVQANVGVPTVRALSANQFVVAFENVDDLYVQLMQVNGAAVTKIGAPLIIDHDNGPGRPAIGQLSSTEFVVFGDDWLAHDIRVGANGLQLVGATISDASRSEVEYNVRVAQTAPGQFVAYWHDEQNSADDPTDQLVLQRFGIAPDGTVDEQPTLTAGADLMDGATGNDTIVGLAGNDVLHGGAGDDRVFGGLDNDTVSDTAGSNYLRGDEGNDSLLGGTGFDDINGNMGNDTAVGGQGDDWVVGGKDDDLLRGGVGNDLVYGNLGNDTCEGGDGADTIRGGQDNDLVQGDDGNDYVSGDRGSDTMWGGSGADIFHTFGEAGIDRVMDFRASSGDRVQVDPGTQYTVSQVGQDTVISMVGGGQMTLVGVNMGSLAPGWIFGA